MQDLFVFSVHTYILLLHLPVILIMTSSRKPVADPQTEMNAIFGSIISCLYSQQTTNRITNWTNLWVLGLSGCFKDICSIKTKSLWPVVSYPNLSQCIITSKGLLSEICAGFSSSYSVLWIFWGIMDPIYFLTGFDHLWNCTNASS